MSLRINNNPASVNGIRNLQNNNWRVGKSMEQLSSGLRINRAADDAAGLIISEQMRAQITGLSTAVSNSETAVNMIQTAEGALDEMNTLLNKARSLALSAANEGANDQAQLVANQSELDNIISSITRIAENTQFGTKKILDGSLSTFTSNSPLVGSVATGQHYAENLANGGITKGYHSLRITAEGSQGTLSIAGNLTTGVLTAADGAIDLMSGGHEFQSEFSFRVNGIDVNVVSGSTKDDLINKLNAIGKDAGFSVVLSGATSGAGVTTGNIVLINRDYGTTSNISFQFVSSANTGAQAISGTYTSGTDVQGVLHFYTGTTAGGTAGSGGEAIVLSGKGLTLRNQSGDGYRIELSAPLTITGANTTGGTYLGVIDGNGSGASFQIGANARQTATVALDSMKASDLGRSASGIYDSLAQLGGSLVAGQAFEALAVIDQAIDDVSSTRGRLGAFQSNTLETNINSLKVTRENLISAESTIRDVDFAVESANFTKLQIMVQSSTAMLAQANQLPQNVLQLLG